MITHGPNQWASFQGSFGRRAIFQQTLSAVTSFNKLYDFVEKDLLSAEDQLNFVESLFLNFHPITWGNRTFGFEAIV